MHVSKWPKKPNLVLGPKPGDDSIFTLHPVHSRSRHTSHEETTRREQLHPHQSPTIGDEVVHKCLSHLFLIMDGVIL